MISKTIDIQNDHYFERMDLTIEILNYHKERKYNVDEKFKDLYQLEKLVALNFQVFNTFCSNRTEFKLL